MRCGPKHAGQILAASILGLVAAGTVCAQEPPAATKAETQRISFTERIAPILKEHCTRCHGGMRPRGQVNLEVYKDDAAALSDIQMWERVSTVLREKLMPPEGRPQPKPEEITLIQNWITAEVNKGDCTKKDPGRVTARRLNRVEYRNTIRDLMGVDFRGVDDFPLDDIGYGFDNIGDVLSLPTMLMEKYLAAAESITEEAFKDPRLRDRILFVKPGPDRSKEEAAREIIGAFASRAYRRPVFGDETRRLVTLYEKTQRNGDSFEQGIQTVVQAILISPHFLFRLEFDRNPANNPFTPQPINEFQLASRLSYFLWSSMPDEELMRLARQARLREELDEQVRRMLCDPKAAALAENFGGQWLQVRNLKTAAPDPVLFPNFDEPLRQAMLRETELFFTAIAREDRSILDFLAADFTYVNDRLARHYGFPGVEGGEFRRVSLAGTNRGGILTQGSILTITSNPTRTSPVKRGKFILENILGTPPPPPPPDVPELSEDAKIAESAPLRVRMEQHRTNPNCAVCHQRMDALGFSFENFDAIGAWRAKDGKHPIDSSGTLPSGESFRGPADLQNMLAGKRREEFSRCLAEKMLTYALGRGLESYDKCAVDGIVANLAKQDWRFSALVLEIVKSDPFQMRRGRRMN